MVAADSAADRNHSQQDAVGEPPAAGADAFCIAAVQIPANRCDAACPGSTFAFAS